MRDQDDRPRISRHARSPHSLPFAARASLSLPLPLSVTPLSPLPSLTQSSHSPRCKKAKIAHHPTGLSSPLALNHVLPTYKFDEHPRAAFQSNTNLASPHTRAAANETALSIGDTIITINGKNCYGKMSRGEPDPASRKSEAWRVSNQRNREYERRSASIDKVGQCVGAQLTSLQTLKGCAITAHQR